MRFYIYKIIFIIALVSASVARAEITSTDKPIFSDDSPYAVKLLGDDGGWVSPFLSINFMNPEMKATIPEFMAFRRKPNTQSTYESDAFDNVLFLSIEKDGIIGDLGFEGYLVQATMKKNGRTYYILIERKKYELPDESPKNIFSTFSFPATERYLAGKSYKTVQIEDFLKYFRNTSSITVASLYEKEIKQYMRRGEPIPTYELFFTTNREEMERFRSQANQFVASLRGEENHQAKIDGWAKDIRPALFNARILPTCQKMKGVTDASEELSGQMSDRLGVGRLPRSLYIGMQVSTNNNECAIRSGVLWTSRIYIYSIDFTGCSDGECTVEYELGCYGNACGNVKYQPEKARVVVTEQKAKFIGLVD